MKKLLVMGLIGIMFVSCKTFVGSSRTMDIPIATKDFEVLGFVRLQGKVSKKATSYDLVLTEARKKYNNDKVDVVNIKIDNFKDGDKQIINGLVIKYTDAVLRKEKK